MIDKYAVARNDFETKMVESCKVKNSLIYSLLEHYLYVKMCGMM